jgi:N-formylmaleamate deformylase
MKRRVFLLAAAAVSLIGCASGDAQAAPFKPTRFSAVVKGSGPDVILIPGLASSRDIWTGTVAALPGYRYHLIQVNGFAGAPAGGNAKGQVVSATADEIARYIQTNRLQRPAVVGHSMGGTLTTLIAARNPGLVGKAMIVDMLPQPAGFVGSTAAGVRGLADALKGLTATPGGRRLVESAIEMFGGARPVDRRSDPDVVARATHELAVSDFSDELARVKAPLTVVYAVPADETAPRRLSRQGQARPGRAQRPHDHVGPAHPLPRRAEGLSRRLTPSSASPVALIQTRLP